MKISTTLKKLAKEFLKYNHPLYIVGGFVRDEILGLEKSDIDLASALRPEKVMDICEKLNIDCKVVNRNLGTLLLTTPKEKYEYTTFRKESYGFGHSPKTIEFVSDIRLDSLRRDLTINALYYDITSGEIIDLVDGKKDLENGIIRTANMPEITLSDDGLRILRLIRFASTYNFKYDKATFKAMNLHKQNLLNISKERILNELKLIVTADLKFSKPNTIFWDNVNKLKLLPLIFNHSLTRIKNPNKEEIAKFYNIAEETRILGFYLLILKKYCHSYQKHNQLSFTINMLLGMDGIKESKEIIRLIEKLYLIYENIEYDVDSLNACINYLALNEENRELIFTLLSDKAKLLLQSKTDIIKGNNLPISINELKVTPKLLISKGIEPRYISSIQNALYNMVIEMKINNEKQELLKQAIEINNTFLNLQKKGK